MKKRTKQVCAIIATQTACLGVGLWMQYYYTVSTVMYAATKQCYTDLTSDGADVLNRLGASGLATIADGSLDSDRLARLLNPIRLRTGGVVIADADWRIRHFAGRGDEIGDRGSIVWQTASTEPLLSTTWSQGRFTVGEREHVAVARILPGHAGYLLLVQDIDTLNKTTATFVNALPAISGLTMVWMIVLLSMAAYLLWARIHEDIDEERSRSASESHRHVQDLIRTRDAVIFGLAKLADSRDPETGEHLERISVYSTLLTTAAARDTKFRGTITPTFARLIGISSALHDIGKVGVLDSILNKPGPLTPEEYKAMQKHADIGGDCLREIEQRLGSSNFLQLAREITYAHHENWDGTGYPRGLAGTNIPVAARIVAIADVYDALSCKRIYKEAYPHKECVRIIRADAGRKFDRELVRVWMTIESKFHAIARQFAENRQADGSAKPVNLPATEAESEKQDELCVVTSAASEKPGHM